MQVTPETRTAIIRRVLEEIDETNCHVCGNHWRHLNDLIDRPGAAFGTIAAWVVLCGGEFHGPPRVNGQPMDSLADLEADLDEWAAMFLGIDGDVWEEWFRDQPITIVRENLERLSEAPEYRLDGGL